MALIRCRECGKDVSTEASACPGCGAPINSAPTKKKSEIIAGVIVLIVIVGIAVSMGRPDEKKEKPVEAQATSIADSDAAAVKKVYTDLSSTENELVGAQKQLITLFSGAGKIKSDVDKEKFGAEFKQLLSEIDASVEKGSSMKSPKISNQEASHHIDEAIDAHRKWCLSQQAKIGALLSGKFEQAKEFGASADNLATTEAMELALAYKAVGIEIE